MRGAWRAVLPGVLGALACLTLWAAMRPAALAATADGTIEYAPVIPGRALCSRATTAVIRSFAPNGGT